MTNEITAYEPRNIGELRDFARDVTGTALVPQNYRNKPADAMVAMMYGKETAGLGPLTSLQYIAVINGRPAFYGDALPGIAFNKKMITDMEEAFDGEPFNDGFCAVCIVTRPNGTQVTQRFSVGDAKAAGLWGKQGPWKQYPKRMLQWRARSWAIRDAAPHMLFGATYEELQDDEHRGADNAKVVNPTPANAQPDAMPTFEALVSAHGEEFTLQPVEVEPWIKEQIESATPEELAALAENNPDRDDVKAAVEIAIADLDDGGDVSADAEPPPASSDSLFPMTNGEARKAYDRIQKALKDHGNDVENLNAAWDMYETTMTQLPKDGQKKLGRIYDAELAKIAEADA